MNSSDAESIAWDAIYKQQIGTNSLLIQWAAEVVEAVAEAVEENSYDDLHGDGLHEIADGAVPIYTAEIMELLAAAPTLATETPEIATATSETIEGMAQATFYDLAYTVAAHALREIETQQAYADDE